MHGSIRFYANQPFLIRKGEDGLAGAGYDELGNESKPIADGQPGGFQFGLGLVVRGTHPQDQFNRLLGVGLDELTQGFG